MVKEFNLLISAVGGQGGLLLSRVIGNAALRAGFNVRIGETLGMAQRGGSVFSFVRLGSEVYSPLIPAGQVHVLISLEPVEGLRAARFLSPEHTKMALINTSPVPPTPVTLGVAKYPDSRTILEYFQRLSKDTLAFDVTSLAKRVGSAKVVNSVMLGSLCATRLLPVPLDVVKKTLEEIVPTAFIKVNREAFQIGMKSVHEASFRSRN